MGNLFIAVHIEKQVDAVLFHLLLDEQHFLVLNVYSLGLSPLILENLVKTNFRETPNLDLGEVYLDAQSGIRLPLGILARFNNL